MNVRNTILTLFEYGCLPIINENDTVSVAEIKFGDNDHLAAMVTNLLRAPLLVLLTNVDGLYSDDPRVHPDARLLSTVPHTASAPNGGYSQLSGTLSARPVRLSVIMMRGSETAVV